MPEEPSSNQESNQEEALSLDAEGTPSNRFLHVVLALMLAVPAIIWLLWSPTDAGSEAPGGADVNEVTPTSTSTSSTAVLSPSPNTSPETADL